MAKVPPPQGISRDGQWFTDTWSEGVLFTCGIRSVVHTEQSDFQEIQVVDTERFGRMLVLDGNLQTTELDEGGYHELITHVGLCRKGLKTERGLHVLIIGGGDGGAAREALRHADVARVDLVDIDGRVMDIARDYFPTIWRRPDDSGPLHEDERLHIRAEDGLAFVANAPPDAYDLIVVDASDPVGPGTALYSSDFYGSLRACLRPGGAVTVQAGSFFYLDEVLRRVLHGLAAHFPSVLPYQCFTAIYPGGMWNLVVATLGDNPRDVATTRAEAIAKVGNGCAWYSADIHRSCFALPPVAVERLKQPPPSLEELEARLLSLMEVGEETD